MTQLLVSVRDGQEARAALDGGAAVIDVKEPLYGSLGAAPADRWDEVVRCVQRRVPVSVALGELTDAELPVRLRNLPSVDFAKVGLAGCRWLPDWVDRWRQVTQHLRPAVAPVAVIYADWQQVAAPSPLEVLYHAQQLGCRAVLWDTCRKDGTRLFDHLPVDRLTPLTKQARDAGQLVVLAGSLGLADLLTIQSLAPDFVAVRGAVCDGARVAAVQQSRVSEFSDALMSHTPRNTPDGCRTR